MIKIRNWIIRKLLRKEEKEMILHGMLSAYYNSSDEKCIDNQLCWDIVHTVIGTERVVSGKKFIHE